ncbi:nucleotidyltransferase domain-containing protein [Candidatus Pacearchaeota archaeon]|nr:nucleotidyltransferase domain-containing protein [Candidatus Pacearchaeota archaeon]
MIILFGSYSRGEDTKTSDIDLAVIGRKDKILDLYEFEASLNRKINVNFYESWKKIHIHLKNNLLDGIIFSGAVDL